MGSQAQGRNRANGAHNHLTGIQGGATSEYYHFVQSVYDLLKDQDQSVLEGAMPTFRGDNFSNIPFSAMAEQMGRSSTFSFACPNSSAKAQAQADYVCTDDDFSIVMAQAMTALPSTGGNIQLLDGTFFQKTPVIYTKENVAVQGVGIGTKLFPHASVGQGGITQQVSMGKDFGALRNLWLDGDVDRVSYQVIISNNQYSWVTNCRIGNSQTDGIVFGDNTDYGFATNNYLYNHFRPNKSFIDSTSSLELEDGAKRIICMGNVTYNSNAGVYPHTHTDITTGTVDSVTLPKSKWTDNTYTDVSFNTQHYVEWKAGSANAGTTQRVQSIVEDGGGQITVTLSEDTPNNILPTDTYNLRYNSIDEIIIANNIFCTGPDTVETMQGGIYIQNGADNIPTEGVLVAGNTVKGGRCQCDGPISLLFNGNSFFDSPSIAPAVHMTAGTEVNFTNNLIKRAGAVGLQINSEDAIVTGNRIYDCQTSGVFFANTATGGVATGNFFSGNAKQGFFYDIVSDADYTTLTNNKIKANHAGAGIRLNTIADYCFVTGNSVRGSASYALWNQGKYNRIINNDFPELRIFEDVTAVDCEYKGNRLLNFLGRGESPDFQDNTLTDPTPADRIDISVATGTPIINNNKGYATKTEDFIILTGAGSFGFVLIPPSATNVYVDNTQPYPNLNYYLPTPIYGQIVSVNRIALSGTNIFLYGSNVTDELINGEAFLQMAPNSTIKVQFNGVEWRII